MTRWDATKAVGWSQAAGRSGGSSGMSIRRRSCGPAGSRARGLSALDRQMEDTVTEHAIELVVLREERSGLVSPSPSAGRRRREAWRCSGCSSRRWRADGRARRAAECSASMSAVRVASGRAPTPAREPSSLTAGGGPRRGRRRASRARRSRGSSFDPAAADRAAERSHELRGDLRRAPPAEGVMGVASRTGRAGALARVSVHRSGSYCPTHSADRPSGDNKRTRFAYRRVRGTARPSP